MSLLKLIGLILAAYLAAGRTGSIAACLFSGISWWETLIIAILIDFIQIPVYGYLLETSQKHMILPKRFQAWVNRKINKLQERMHKSDLWKRLGGYQTLAVFAVSTIPFRGFGIFSACILAFMLGYGRFISTVLVMSGSFIGSILSILIFFLPARWVGAL